jgi:multiple sugar transport system substrate-binding protein
MAEITFSIYGDQISPLENPSFLLDEFKSRYRSAVNVERMTWEEAWPKLLGYAIYGGGPHISQIGAIWTSTLASMNVLRPFTSREIAYLGGVGAFYQPTWQNAILTEQSKAWGIPVNAFTYLILYRRDLLQRAGIDEHTAFESAEAMNHTLEQLHASGIESPLVLPSGKPFRARVHLLTSWVWGAGGDYVSDDGAHILFDRPEALAGMSAFFNLYRYMSPGDSNLTYDECIQRFATGHAAVTIGGSSSRAVIKQWNVPNVLDNLGVATMPGVPWVGGANLIIWKEAQMHPDKEKTAVSLANFLVSSAAQAKCANAQNIIPARIDALSHVQFESPQFSPAIHQSLMNGRAYKPVPLWVRMLNDFRHVCDTITADILANPAGDTYTIITNQFSPLAQRFSLMLS